MQKRERKKSLRPGLTHVLQKSPGLKDGNTDNRTRFRQAKSGKKGYCLLVNTEAINDEPVFYKYITPQAKAFGNFYV